jgi:Resolvase, N terminal domain
VAGQPPRRPPSIHAIVISGGGDRTSPPIDPSRAVWRSSTGWRGRYPTRATSSYDLTRRSVRLNLGGAVHDPTDPVGAAAVQRAGHVAEFETDLIRARTREGMKVAKANGRLRGKQPKLSPTQEAHLVDLHRSGSHTRAELAELFNAAPLDRLPDPPARRCPAAGGRITLGDGDLRHGMTTMRPPLMAGTSCDASAPAATIRNVKADVERTAGAIEALADADAGWMSSERDRLCNDPRFLRRLAREADERAADLDAFGLTTGVAEWRAIAQRWRRMARNLH